MQGEPTTSLLDYEKLGIIAYLTATVTLFLRGTIMTTASHDKQMASICAVYEQRLKDRDARIEAEKERVQEWKDMAKSAGLAARQTATAAKEIVEVVRTAGGQ
jgi:uncharacterized protein YecA (UPF0149 family)